MPSITAANRFIGFDIVTKKLNVDIQSVMYAFMLSDCCITHEGLIARKLQ